METKIEELDLKDKLIVLKKMTIRLLISSIMMAVCVKFILYTAIVTLAKDNFALLSSNKYLELFIIALSILYGIFAIVTSFKTGYKSLNTIYLGFTNNLIKIVKGDDKVKIVSYLLKERVVDMLNSSNTIEK